MPRALVCDKTGDPTLPVGSGVLRVANDYQCPTLKPGHVRVAVTAASVNYADPLRVKGEYQVKMPLPFVPGSEASGTVVECGKGVTRLSPGDKVVLFQQGGAFAEETVVHEAAVWKVPDGVDLAVAAAVPVTYGTADLALRHRANTQPGQTVLVLGAGGGVGVAAVQIAKVIGAKVIAVTQGAQKCDFLRQQGADAVIDTSTMSKEQPLHKLIKAHAPKGVHVVIDPVGGVFFSEALKSVAWGAHIAVIGFAAGGIPKIPANILLVKNTTVHGLFWGSYMQHDPKILRSSMDDIMAWFAKGQLQPHVSHSFSLEEAPQAFKTMLERKMMGKILITPGPRSKM
uniref:Enoyl reductase (ER) domain-containing protein n=1 Tax=Chlamydomonas leiostraca TaxID=1034604 RepID=A0A7S0S512_9CHLO|mmetsp:Transcript_7915/g.19794  ORF Transcript_7915/g.19794 Transcript_7915/m.19794 type:complete len:342 (+) Transcript_7915:81-1106(+)|eukprot:CAMPEP_0202868828 /NCGR_PEP_ID=MMETSP1391-20130828/11177_1 /ASSEMBLY_ACC=CAM_ASM_000867 /TAXON_ID=1034604 /ORGANISM="Chlamydomonas leiostraca, Strain SAG 11-49" /LENGTH=341 /DNA_ID=CAMNT_0049549039 /DNA_START=81 /DNA_END=1106 /DNA_ORIENTATION=-